MDCYLVVASISCYRVFASSANTSVLLVFLVLVEGNSCPDGYVRLDKFSNHCYKVYTTNSTTNEAVGQCRADGGYLASIPNGFDNSYIRELGVSADVPYMWIGVECLFDYPTNRCVNDDWTKFGPYDNFAPGQPSVWYESPCTYMRLDNGYWYSGDCDSYHFPFVCKIILTPVAVPQCPSNYVLHNGLCYGAIPTQLTRPDASDFCNRTVQGRLASVPSAEMNTFLLGLGYNGWIGLSCINVTSQSDTSSCIWDDETPFEYSNFENIGWPSECTYMTSNGWSGRDCTSTVIFFYCETLPRNG